MTAPSPSSTTTQTWRSRRWPRLTDAWATLDHRHSRTVLLLASTYLLVFLFVLALGASWAHDDASPSIRVLGSGSKLSLLVTSGRTRLLISTGDDASAFANALSIARHPTSRRVDVIVVAGDAGDLSVASRAIRDHPNSAAFAIDGPLVDHLPQIGLTPEQVIANPTRIRLSGNVQVTIRPSKERDGGWSAMIERGYTIVLAASSMTELDVSRSASAVILCAEYDAEMLANMKARALVLPTRAVSWSNLYQDAAASDGGQIWAIPIQPGRATRLTFTDRGLRLPSSAREITARSPTSSLRNSGVRDRLTFGQS